MSHESVTRGVLDLFDVGGGCGSGFKEYYLLKYHLEKISFLFKLTLCFTNADLLKSQALRRSLFLQQL